MTVTDATELLRRQAHERYDAEVFAARDRRDQTLQQLERIDNLAGALPETVKPETTASPTEAPNGLPPRPVATPEHPSALTGPPPPQPGPVASGKRLSREQTRTRLIEYMDEARSASVTDMIRALDGCTNSMIRACVKDAVEAGELLPVGNGRGRTYSRTGGRPLVDVLEPPEKDPPAKPIPLDEQPGNNLPDGHVALAAQLWGLMNTHGSLTLNGLAIKASRSSREVKATLDWMIENNRARNIPNSDKKLPRLYAPVRKAVSA